jgi:hypothetical protein
VKAQSPETLVFRIAELLSIPFLLLVVPATNASLAVTPQDAILNTSLSTEESTTKISCTCSYVCTCSNIAEPINDKLANLGRELLHPPPQSSISLNNTVKSLPAVPRALFMVLTGFLCVSLIKDRRVWLTALAGILWAGQAGVQALPQLALHLCHRTHTSQHLSPRPTQFYLLEDTARTRSDIEGTRYIGLLHHLAGIPHANSASNRCHTTFITLSQHRQKVFGRAFSHPNKNTFPPLSAIISKQHSLNALSKCLASTAKQFICFSPAFIFDSLPRGPPKNS